MTLSEKVLDDLFSNVGIDSIGFHTPSFYIGLDNLARLRDVNPDKFHLGLMTYEMRIPDRGEDCISLGVKAGYNALLRGNIHPKDIDALFVGTEATIYAVKSISNIYRDTLGISANCFTQDVSNACAAGTLAIINALSMIETGIINKALVITVDISKYDLKSPGEPTQGAGAVAMVLSRNPRLAVFGKNFGKISSNINDFYRPEGESNAQVFGQYSVNSYISLQLSAFDDLKSQIGDFYADYYIFHAPYSKLPLKLMQKLIAKHALKRIKFLLKHDIQKSNKIEEIPYFEKFSNSFLVSEEIDNIINEMKIPQEEKHIIQQWVYKKIRNTCLPPLQVSSMFGNMYSASIWGELMYLLERYGKNNDTIYFGSYGSGATAITGLLKVQPKFKSVLANSLSFDSYFFNKEQISVEKYEDLRRKTEIIDISWAKLIQKSDKHKFGFQLKYCSEGCNLSHYNGLDYCPKGHLGNKSFYFPIIGNINEVKPFIAGDLSPLYQGYVLVLGNPKLGALMEFEYRRWKNVHESNPKHGLLNWIPIYREVFRTPYLEMIEMDEKIEVNIETPIEEMNLL